MAYSTASVLRDFEEDGTCYLELRTTPRTSIHMTKAQYVSTVLDCIQSYKSSTMSTNLILSVDRKNSASEAMEVVDLAIRNKNYGVVGVDLCGDPSRSCSVDTFKEAFTKARAFGLGITLHFAEVPESSTEEELQMLLSFRPDRVGHVIHVNERVEETLAEKHIGLELCLSCNIKAGMIEGGYDSHHFRYWWLKEHRGPIALCVS